MVMCRLFGIVPEEAADPAEAAAGVIKKNNIFRDKKKKKRKIKIKEFLLQPDRFFF